MNPMRFHIIDGSAHSPNESLLPEVHEFMDSHNLSSTCPPQWFVTQGSAGGFPAPHYSCVIAYYPEEKV